MALEQWHHEDLEGALEQDNTVLQLQYVADCRLYRLNQDFYSTK